MNFEELVKEYGQSFCEEYYNQFMDWCVNCGYISEPLEEE